MRVVVAGGSGFLGTPLRQELAAAGHEVIQLVRRPPTEPDQLRWDPGHPVSLPDDTGAVINLCGVGIGHRWTQSYKKLIRSSRIVPTTRLAQAVARQGIPVLINASGVGFYGETGDRIVDEGSGPGDDFLARLAADWERATRPAQEAGARVVRLRTGLPLDKDGGFLKPQLLPFRLGIGGKLGSGRQWIPWISLRDWLRAAMFVLSHEQIEGPVNLAGPEPVTNAEATKALARALHRPAIFPVPRLGVRIVFGKYAAEEGYRSLRVMPKVLRDNGFDYDHPTFTSALAEALR
ncbi:MAG TPA: TIGR01777 family oxidoreductase [Candidatus Limnocylindrales bacterium]|nr:TIGR01777 family oxidoreductase [Candidatus Limnocylindrales bacterium]